MLPYSNNQGNDNIIDVSNLRTKRRHEEEFS